MLPGITYRELMREIPWGVILRMLADLPYIKYFDEEGKEKGKSKVGSAKELTPQTAEDFKKYIQELNEKNKR